VPRATPVSAVTVTEGATEAELQRDRDRVFLRMSKSGLRQSQAEEQREVLLREEARAQRGEPSAAAPTPPRPASAAAFGQEPPPRVATEEPHAAVSRLFAAAEASHAATADAANSVPPPPAGPSLPAWRVSDGFPITDRATIQWLASKGMLQQHDELYNGSARFTAMELETALAAMHVVALQMPPLPSTPHLPVSLTSVAKSPVTAALHSARFTGGGFAGSMSPVMSPPSQKAL
jgi:hypothetical protein